MKHDDLRRESSPDAPRKPRVLVPLFLGSITLHGLIWWAAARLPAPPAQAPQTLTEVQLSDLPAPQKTPKPEATPVTKPKPPRLTRSPRAADASPVRSQPASPDPLLPEPQQIAPTAPLVRSQRAVSETGVASKKPLAKKPTVPRPTAAPQTLASIPLVPRPTVVARVQTPAPVPSPQRAPDAIVPRPQKPKPATETPADKPAPVPTVVPTSNAGANRSETINESGNVDSNQNSGIGNKSKSNAEKRAGSGIANGSVDGPANKASNDDVADKKDAVSRNDAANSAGGGGLFGLGSGPFGIAGGTDKKPRPKNTQSDKNSPLAGAGKNKGTALGQGTGSGQGGNAGAGKGGDDGGNSGAGGGPFGIGGDAGEGPRRIVYMLDISYSMEPRFERAKQELRDALSGLRAGESFNIIGVYGNARPFEPRLVEATPRNIDKGRAFIDSLRLSRYTNLEIAFEKAFAAPDVNVVVLITDGVPTYGLGSPDFDQSGKPDISANFGELAQRVRQLNRVGARIYTIGLADKKDDKFEAAGLLQRIARENGGNFKTVRIDEKP